ncbi:MAG: DEAD/DEAH box helicase [Vicinamibacterales bacterium]
MASTLEHGVAVLDEALRPYQREGVSFLFRNEAALLADEMGLGKTVQAITALRLLLRKPKVDRALIVAPASLGLNWQREFERWAPELVVRRLTGSQADRLAYYELPIAVLIATYEQISVDALDRVPDEAFNVVVLDEAQRIKNYSSRTAFACRLLPRDIAWALTGTPIENSRSDIESIFEFLRPGLLRQTDGKAKLLAAIAPHFLRRRKAEVVKDLPPIIFQDIDLELTDAQRSAYDAAWDAGSTALRRAPHPIPTSDLLALITRLKQICNFEPDAFESCKVDALQVLLETASTAGAKVLLFSQYVETLNRLSRSIDSMPASVYSGEQSAAERDDVLTAFERESGSRLLLMSLRAGGVGLNIPSADLVVLFDRWWNPAVEAQAVNRAHRLGRKTPLHVVRFLVRDSIEERIDAILTAKQQLFDDYVESVDGAEVPALTRNDLIHALGISHYDTDAQDAVLQNRS